MDPLDPRSAAWASELRGRLDELLDGYRASLHDCLDGLTEDEARLRLVPSTTTLLGLVQHVTFVEGVWFDQAIGGRSYAEIGIPSTPARSFALSASDTIASVQDAYRQRCEASRATMAELSLDTVVTGRGERPVWSLLLQVLRVPEPLTSAPPDPTSGSWGAEVGGRDRGAEGAGQVDASRAVIASAASGSYASRNGAAAAR